MKCFIHRAKNTKKRIFTCASSCYSTDKFCLIIQFCDSYAEIDGYGRTEIVKVYAVVIPEFFKPVGQGILMDPQPSRGLGKIEHGLAPVDDEIHMHGRILILQNVPDPALQIFSFVIFGGLHDHPLKRYVRDPHDGLVRKSQKSRIQKHGCPFVAFLHGVYGVADSVYSDIYGDAAVFLKFLLYGTAFVIDVFGIPPGFDGREDQISLIACVHDDYDILAV